MDEASQLATLRSRIEDLAAKLSADPLRFSPSDLATDLRSLLDDGQAAEYRNLHNPEYQKNWFGLIEATGGSRRIGGSTAAARAKLAAALRLAADYVETDDADGCNPGIYGCSIPESGLVDHGCVMGLTAVVFSYPWGG